MNDISTTNAVQTGQEAVSTIRPYEELSRRQKNMIRIRKVKRGQPLKWLPLILSVVLLFVFLLTGFSSRKKAEYLPLVNDDEAFSMSFVGDVMLARFIEEAYADSPDAVFDDIRPFIEGSDLAFANIEFSCGNSSDRITNNPVFVTGRNALDSILENGFNVFSMANDHMFDNGADELKKTAQYLNQKNIYYSGIVTSPEENISYTSIVENGKKIGFISITDVFNPVDNLPKYVKSAISTGKKRLTEIIAAADAECDLVVAYMHWGTENTPAVSEVQKAQGKMLIDAGADIIIGSHPNVLQPVEKYKNGIIFYSLGNFIFDQGNSFSNDSVIVNYCQNTDGSSHFILYPCRISEGKPFITANRFYCGRIAKALTKHLNETDYTIHDDGYIVIK